MPWRRWFGGAGCDRQEGVNGPPMEDADPSPPQQGWGEITDTRQRKEQAMQDKRNREKRLR